MRFLTPIALAALAVLALAGAYTEFTRIPDQP
jgi:hypothetical protein